MVKTSSQTTLDRTGVSLSILCLIHCIAGQILISLFPIFHTLTDERIFHTFLGPILLLIATYAFYNGYKRHQHKRVLLLGLAGIAFILAGILVPHEHIIYSIPLPVWVSSVGSIFLISAHVWNIKYSRCTKTRHHH